MPLMSISPTIQVNGSFNGDVLPIPLTVTEFMIPDVSGFQIRATFVPERLFWNDYGTNPLQCALNIVNHEQTPLIGPIGVRIQFDQTRIAYVPDSMTGSDGVQVENVAFDASSGTLSFELPDEIPAEVGSVSLNFQIDKPKDTP